MAKKVYYSGKNLWLRSFDFFEVGPDGKFTGVYGMVDGVQVVAGTPGAIPNRIELEHGFNREVQEHHMDEEVGKERRIDRLKNLLESQVKDPINWPALEMKVHLSPPHPDTKRKFLALKISSAEVEFVFDESGDNFLGVVNYKE